MGRLTWTDTYSFWAVCIFIGWAVGALLGALLTITRAYL